VGDAGVIYLICVLFSFVGFGLGMFYQSGDIVLISLIVFWVGFYNIIDKVEQTDD
jgi:hypothetical protein